MDRFGPVFPVLGFVELAAARAWHDEGTHAHAAIVTPCKARALERERAVRSTAAAAGGEPAEGAREKLQRR